MTQIRVPAVGSDRQWVIEDGEWVLKGPAEVDRTLPVVTPQQYMDPGFDLRDISPGYTYDASNANGHPVGDIAQGPTYTPPAVLTGHPEGIILEPGADTRDQAEGLVPAGGGPIAAVAGVGVGIAVRLAMQALRRIMGPAVTVTRRHWDSLPGWARQALVAAGIYIGFNIGQDIPGVPGEGFDWPGGGGQNGHWPTHMVDGHLGAHVVGGWMANGIAFLRLSDGKLAAQKKNGSWKVWMPKKPIVIMPGGAANLKTLLRADAVLNRQSKRIATMLNRRAPRGPRRSKQLPQTPEVMVVNAKST